MGVIKRLPESVVNRIAAGEVVVRPANAVKELIENSLDAGASEIIVSIQQGGLALLQVQDNGKGIQKEDLEMVCERFATSKLSQFEDLQAMKTYGFRGEALASISLVSKVTITSRPKGQQCAYQAKYADCRMVSVKASAGNEGTSIAAEDLFYNADARKQSFRNYGEEAAKVAEVVTKYAVHRPDVSFALRRGGNGSDFRTKGDGLRSTVISMLIGADCSQNLMDVDHISDHLKYRLNGCLSEPLSAATAKSVQAKKNRQRCFYLFINGRSVQCAPLKFAVDALFSDRDLICPFVLLSLELEPSRIDVNVHPTKSNVVFLEEEAIIEDVREYISTLLPGTVDSQLAPLSIPTATQILRMPMDRVKSSDSDDSSQEGSPRAEKKLYDHQLVRTDTRERSLLSFIEASPCASRSSSDVTMVPVLSSSQGEEVQYSQEEDGSCRRVFSLESLHNLKRKICAESCQSMRELLKAHTFVGCVDPERVLLQHSTSLYVLNLRKVSEEMFYQIAVFGFGNFGCYKLEEPVPVEELFLASSRVDDLTEGDARLAVELLRGSAEMLHDYLSVSFEEGEEGLQLTAIPSLISGFLPQLEGLPDLIYDLVHVPWDEEESCFYGLCLAVARFFTVKTQFCQGDQISGLSESADWRTVVRDLLLPRVKTRLIPQEKFKEGYVCRAADLHDLYKVFERC